MMENLHTNPLTFADNATNAYSPYLALGTTIIKINLISETFRPSLSCIAKGTYFFGYLQGTGTKEKIRLPKIHKSYIFLVGDLFSLFLVMVGDVVFKTGTFQNELISSF